MTPAAMIDISLVPPLERKLLGGTFYAAMVRFYENPENQRRFEKWREERNRKENTEEVIT